MLVRDITDRMRSENPLTVQRHKYPFYKFAGAVGILQEGISKLPREYLPHQDRNVASSNRLSRPHKSYPLSGERIGGSDEGTACSSDQRPVSHRRWPSNNIFAVVQD